MFQVERGINLTNEVLLMRLEWNRTREADAY